MKYNVLFAVPLLFVAACGREEPVSYQVPKEKPAAAPVKPMGSDADNAAVIAAHAAMNAQAPAGLGYTATLAEGWTEVPGSGMRKASYTIDGTSIDFYLISLGMGDLPSNVNRWRGQVSLAPASAEEIAAAAETLDVDGHAASYIEIYNEEGGRGIIAAIVPVGSQFWYFTAKGTVGELKANAGNIRAFLESIKVSH